MSAKPSPALLAATDVHLGVSLAAAAAYLAPPTPLPKSVTALSWIPLDGFHKAAYLGCVDTVVPAGTVLQVDAAATATFNAFLQSLYLSNCGIKNPLSIIQVPYAEAKSIFTEQQSYVSLERLRVLNQVEYTFWRVSGACERPHRMDDDDAPTQGFAYHALLQDRHFVGQELLKLARATPEQWKEALGRFHVVVTSNLGLLVMSADAQFNEVEHMQVLTIALQGRSAVTRGLSNGSSSATPRTDQVLIAESEARFTMRVAELAKNLALKAAAATSGPPSRRGEVEEGKFCFGASPMGRETSVPQSSFGSPAADSLAPAARGQLLLVTGPSASGKTTFANKLSLALRALGFAPIAISMDEYYRDSTTDPSYPRNPDGTPNHEVVECLRLEELKENIETLLNYGAVELPQFDMANSKPKPKTGKNLKSLPLGAKGVLIVEGIFALSPVFVRMMAAETITKIFVAPSPDVGLTETIVIPNQTVRLIRRISRDFLHRGRNARASIARVPGVEVGEDHGIFPSMRHAEIVFNTFVDYELGLLRVYVLPLLKKIEPSDSTFAEAQWLLQLLDGVESVSDRSIGSDALVREFIGGSIFEEAPLDMHFDNRPANLVGKRFSFCRAMPWLRHQHGAPALSASVVVTSLESRNDGVSCIWDKLDEVTDLKRKEMSTVFGDVVDGPDRPLEESATLNSLAEYNVVAASTESEAQATPAQAPFAPVEAQTQGSDESSGDPFERLDTESTVLAMLNRRQIVPLHLPLEGSDYFHGAELHAVPLNTRDGLKAYDTTAIVVLHVAVKKVLGTTHRLVVLHQFVEEGDRFCVQIQEGTRVVKISDDDVQEIKAMMATITKEGHSINLRYVSPATAVEMFLRQRMTNTVSLLESSTRSKILVAHVCGIPSLAMRPLLPNTKFIKSRALQLDFCPENNGCLTFTVGKPNLAATPGVAATLFQLERKAVDTDATMTVCQYREQVLAAQRLFSVGELNNTIFSGKVSELVCVDEAIQFNLIHQITERVEKHAHRVVFLAGSSSAGKTVVSSRLRTLLSAKGYSVEVISTDWYYRNASDEDYPRYPNGAKNYDTVEALRLPLLIEQLQRLLSTSQNKSTMQVPTFDLGAGKILPGTRAMTVPLPARGVVIVEGLFALCPQITEPIRAFALANGVGSPLCVMIHPMPVLNYDELHLMSAKTLRLLRRCVRDYFVRGRTARETLERRRIVEDQEILNTLPFAQHADLIVSPCCVYEAAALRSSAEMLLNYVPDSLSDGGEAVRKAMELKSELSWIAALSHTQLPDIAFVRDLLESTKHQ